MQRYGLSSHRIGQIAPRQNVIVRGVLTSPGISAPKVHRRVHYIVNASGHLVIVRWKANKSRVIGSKARPVRRWNKWSLQELRYCRIPTLLRDRHVGPWHIGVGIGVVTARGQSISAEELRRTVWIGD